MELRDRVQNSLDEARMLVLGAEILIGFQFTATFQQGFRQLTRASQYANLAALFLTLLTLAFLMAPATFHQIALKGNDSPSVVRFTSRVMEIALFPFALAIGVSVFIPGREIAGALAGKAIAVVATTLALLFWYGPALLPAAKRAKEKEEHPSMKSAKYPKPEPTGVHDKIRQVLTEARVIIPGNQALLGFQLAVTLQQRFRDLQPALQRIHLVSLLLLALSTILLLAPAPYHRIVERGEETERFYRVASCFVLSSLPRLRSVYAATCSWLSTP